jgi:hypothetical protein
MLFRRYHDRVQDFARVARIERIAAGAETFTP